MGDTAKKGKRARVGAVPDSEPKVDADGAPADEPAHDTAICPVAWCPVCLAVAAVQPARPEVVEHLLKAGTEFFLALRSLIDARADEVAPRDDTDDPDAGFQKIDIG